jgi:hypothetical protein
MRKSSRVPGAGATPIVGIPLRIDPRITSSQRLTLDTAAGEPGGDSTLSRAVEALYGPDAFVLGIFTTDDPATYRAPDRHTRQLFEQLAGLLVRPRDPSILPAVLDAIAELAPNVELLELRDGTLQTIERGQP